MVLMIVHFKPLGGHAQALDLSWAIIKEFCWLVSIKMYGIGGYACIKV